AGRLRHAMTTEEKQVLESLVEKTERFSGPTTLLRRGDLTDVSTLLIEGYLMRTIVENDQRFVVELHVPGDFADLHAFALKRLDHDLVSVGETLVGQVSHERLQAVLKERPHLARLLWYATLLDASV